MEKNAFFALGGNANEAEEDDDHNSLAGRVELHMMLAAAQLTRPMPSHRRRSQLASRALFLIVLALALTLSDLASRKTFTLSLLPLRTISSRLHCTLSCRDLMRS